MGKPLTKAAFGGFGGKFFSFFLVEMQSNGSTSRPGIVQIYNTPCLELHTFAPLKKNKPFTCCCFVSKFNINIYPDIYTNEYKNANPSIIVNCIISQSITRHGVFG